VTPAPRPRQTNPRTSIQADGVLCSRSHNLAARLLGHPKKTANASTLQADRPTYADQHNQSTGLKTQDLQGPAGDLSILL